MDLLASKSDFVKVAKRKPYIIARIESLETTADKFSAMVKFIAGDFSFKQKFDVEISEYQDFTIMPGYKEELYFVYEGDRDAPYFASDELARTLEEQIRNYFDKDVVISYGF